jgi:hypothetical protein
MPDLQLSDPRDPRRIETRPSMALSTWPVLSATGSATAGGAVAALVLATSGHLASTWRVEFGRGTLASPVRAFRA